MNKDFKTMTTELVVSKPFKGNTTVARDMFSGFYYVTAKNVGGTSSLVGTVQSAATAVSDASMADAVVTITADDAGDKLQITFTPPSSAGSTTQMNIIAHVDSVIISI